MIMKILLRLVDRFRSRSSGVPSSRLNLILPVGLSVGLVLWPAGGRAEEVEPVGNLFQVDEISAPAVAQSPRAAWNNQSSFAVVWRDNFEGSTPFDCLLRLFDLDGQNWSSVEVMNYYSGDEGVRWPDVAPSSQGYVVSFAQDSSTYPGLFDVFAAAADHNGVYSASQEATLNYPCDFTTLDAAIGGDGNDRFLVAWADMCSATRDPPDLRDIFARRVNAAVGLVDTTDFIVNYPRFFDTFADTPAVAANANGDHLVVWSDDRVLLKIGDEQQPRSDIYARLVPRTFEPIDYEDLDTPGYMVSADDAFVEDAVRPRVAFGEGFFVVAWEDETDICARPLDSDGVPLHTEFPVNDPYGTAAIAAQPSVVHFGTGRFAIMWRDSRDGGSIRVRMYEPEKHIFRSEDVPMLTQVNEDAFPAAASTNLGRFLAVWQGPPDDAHILGHLFDFWKPGDLTGEGILNGLDMLRFCITWNPNASQPVDTKGDIDGDGDVDGDDLLWLHLLRLEDRAEIQKPVQALKKPASSMAVGIRYRELRETGHRRPPRKITRPRQAAQGHRPNAGDGPRFSEGTE